MRLHNCNRPAVSIRYIVILLLLIICVLISNTETADADVYVSGNFYYASGIVAIGGVALYFIISSGTRGHYAKKVKPGGNSTLASMYASDFELHNYHSDFDNLFNEGLLKIYTW